MQASSGNTSKKENKGCGLIAKAILAVVILGAVVSAIQDGDTDVNVSDQPPYADTTTVYDYDAQGAATTSVGGYTRGDKPTTRRTTTSTRRTTTQQSKITTQQRKTTTRGKITTTTKRTTTTRQTLPYASNVFADGKGIGGCRELIGNVKVTVVFANDPTASWTGAAIEAEKKELAAEAQKLMSEAARYGQTLQLSFVYKTATATKVPSINDENTFVTSALHSAGLPTRDKLNSTLKQQYGCAQAPVVFCVNHGGRSFAQWGHDAEHAVLFQEGTNPFAHELLHQFGADDFYYPNSVKSLAEELFGKSVMLSSSTVYVDELTAYLVGWTSQPSTKAVSFLKQTNHITKEMMNAEYEKNTYTGYVKDYNDGNGRYTGNLVNGYRHGQGTYIYDNGNSYTGSWHNGHRHGKGVFRWADSNSAYDGDWSQDLMHGQGTYRWGSGNVYTGTWVNSKMHGKGTFTWGNGDVYTGDWVEDKRQGQGTFTWKQTGNSYTGGWAASKMHGKGTITFDNGKYVGDFQHGVRTGYGIYYWHSGARHEGQWENNQRHGNGVYYNADGTVGKQGVWQNDTFVE